MNLTPIVGAVIADDQQTFNGVTDSNGCIYYNIDNIFGWYDYPDITIDGDAAPDSQTLDDFFDALINSPGSGEEFYASSGVVSTPNRDIVFIAGWTASEDAQGYLQLVSYSTDGGALYDVTYASSGVGTVSPSSNTGIPNGSTGGEIGHSVTGATATPNSGYSFDGWYVGDRKIEGATETLTPETAAKYVNKYNTIYFNTTFTARFSGDTYGKVDDILSHLADINWPYPTGTVLTRYGDLANANMISAIGLNRYVEGVDGAQTSLTRTTSYMEGLELSNTDAITWNTTNITSGSIVARISFPGVVFLRGYAVLKLAITSAGTWTIGDLSSNLINYYQAYNASIYGSLHSDDGSAVAGLYVQRIGSAGAASNLRLYGMGYVGKSKTASSSIASGSTIRFSGYIVPNYSNASAGGGSWDWSNFAINYSVPT